MSFLGLAKNIVLAISISIILSMFLHYSFEIFVKSPDYRDYCNETIYPQKVLGENFTAAEKEVYDKAISEYQEKDIECQKSFELAMEKYQKPRFIFLAIAGIIAIIIGGLIISIEGIGIGVLLGGVFSVISGTAGYWRQLGEFVKVFMLGAVLVVLIWVGVKIAKRESKPKNKKK